MKHAVTFMFKTETSDKSCKGTSLVLWNTFPFTPLKVFEIIQKKFDNFQINCTCITLIHIIFCAW